MFRNRNQNALTPIILANATPSTSSSGGGVGGGGLNATSARSSNLTSNFLKTSKLRKLSVCTTGVPTTLAPTEVVDGLSSENVRNRHDCRTLIIVFSTLEEFAAEREVLRNMVLPELQQHCSEKDIDLELLMFYETGDLIENNENYSLFSCLMSDETTHALCFVGDKYGKTMLPIEIRQNEYDGIQTAVLELSSELKLFDQFYTLKKTVENPELNYYCLKPVTVRDPNAAKRLCKVLQKAVKKTIKDDSIQNANANCQKLLLKSFIEMFTETLLENPAKNLFVTRKLLEYKVQNASNDRYFDLSSITHKKVSALKNRISVKYCQSYNNNYFPFVFNLNNSSASSWLNSKEFSVYERQLAQKLTDRLKQVLALPSAQILTPIVRSAKQIIDAENEAHEMALAKITPKTWVAREPIDTKLEKIVKQIFDINLPSCYVQFYGGVGVGKTSILCRLHQLIQAKFHCAFNGVKSEDVNNNEVNQIEKKTNVIIEENTKSPKKCIVITRFVSRTECSMFANELFRNIFLKAIHLGNVEDTQDALLESFHLSKILEQGNLLSERFACPLVLLIDDIHLMRYGSVLSKLEKPAINNLSRNLSIIMFSATTTPFNGIYSMPEFVEIPTPNQSVAIKILKNRSLDGKSLRLNHISILKQNMASSNVSQTTNKKMKTANGTINVLNTDNVSTDSSNSDTMKRIESDVTSQLIMGEVQCDELLAEQLEISKNIDARFTLIELRCGAENTRIVSQLLCCCDSFGITRLELLDAFRLRKRTSGMEFEPDGVLSAAAVIVLKQFGCLVIRFCVNNRELWSFRHASVLQFARQRYLQSAGEIKLINEILAQIMKYPSLIEDEENEMASCLIFSQPINRENGAVNLRRVRFHWYFLLYTGNIQTLKSLTLCSFEYLEATFRGCGLSHLLSIFEECLQQILDYDLLVIFEQVLLPIIPTLIRDERQFVSEFLNRLRYTRSKNSIHLNNFVEQAMQWTDNYYESPLFVPLTCWIPPPKIKQILSLKIPAWKAAKTIIQPTHNHQHLLIAGNDESPGKIYMFHIASQLLVKTLLGHESCVSSICTSRNGHFFVSCAHDGNIKVWNFTQANECIKTLRVSNARILCSVLSADDKWIVTGSVDSTARLIIIESGEILRTFSDHTGSVVDLQLSSDNELLITGSGDFIVMIWDIKKSTIILKMGGLMAPVTCLAITSNDAFLAVACEDETLRVFSMVSAQELHELSGHDSRVNALVVSSDDCQLFAATRGKILTYDIHNGQLLETLYCFHTLPVTSIKISDDNSFLMAACGDQVHMWNINSIEYGALQNDKSTLACVCMSPDEKGAGCGTIDGILAFWDLDVCHCLWTTSQQKSGAVTALDFTVDSLYLLSGNAQGGIFIWEASNGQLLKQLQVHNGGEVSSISCFSDCFRVLSVDKSFTAQLWAISSATDERFFLGGLSNIVNNYGQSNFSGSGQNFSTVSSGGNSNCSNVEELFATICDLKPPIFVRYSAMSEGFIIVGQNARRSNEVNILTVGEDSRVGLISKAQHNQEIVCYHLNKFGTILITGSLDLSLKVWQTDSGFLTQVLLGHVDQITCCCISDDTKMVASGARDKQIIIWDMITGAIRRSIKTTLPLYLIEVSQDSSVIVSADNFGWIEAWRTDNGMLLSSFNTHRRVQQLVMGVDGNRILVRLSQTAQLPILCLHNTPASSGPVVSYRAVPPVHDQKLGAGDHRGSTYSNMQSASSFTSDYSAAEEIGSGGNGLNRLDSKTKRHSTTTNDGAVLRPASAMSTKIKQHKDSISNSNFDKTGNKNMSIFSGRCGSREKKNSGTGSTTQFKNNKSPIMNRKSNMCLVL